MKEDIYNKLDKMGISYKIVEHGAVYTIEEALAKKIENKDKIVKNLFIRDDKKQNYYLLLVPSLKRVNLKELRKKINSRPLSFASIYDLEKYLGLKKGAVSPLGVFNDIKRIVKVIIDKEILSFGIVGVHPNDNTVSVFLKLEDLERISKEHGNELEYLEI